MIVEFKTAYHH